MPVEKTSVEKTRSIILKLSDEKIADVLHALSSRERIKIIKTLGLNSLNVKQIAEKCGLPFSTAALHIRVLEDAGILMSENIPAEHGSMKLCTRMIDFISVNLGNDEVTDINKVSVSMPLGSFSRIVDVTPTCGIVSDVSNIGEYDNPKTFYYPERLEAQLLWIYTGFIEYRFACPVPQNADVEYIELSFEACSEAPMYRNPWLSDISVKINNVHIGVWTSPADLGGRRGRLNPEWWPNTNTQFGYFTVWHVDKSGSFINTRYISDVKVQQLELQKHNSIIVSIGVSKDAKNKGGLNLFGEKFGDYPQALKLNIAYKMS